MPSLLFKSFIILRGLIYSALFVWLWTWLAMMVRPFDADTSCLLTWPNTKHVIASR